MSLISTCKQLVWSTRIGRNMPIWILYWCWQVWPMNALQCWHQSRVPLHGWYSAASHLLACYEPPVCLCLCECFCVRERALHLFRTFRVHSLPLSWPENLIETLTSSCVFLEVRMNIPFPELLDSDWLCVWMLCIRVYVWVYINITCFCIYKKDMGMSVGVWVCLHTTNTHTLTNTVQQVAHEHYLAMIDEGGLD
jgi:hypothetical protein